MKISHYYMTFSPKGENMQEQECAIVLDKSNRETNLKGSKQFPIAIYNDNVTAKAVPYHWHEELELIVVVSGQMKLIVEMQEFILAEGEGIFINTGRLHSCEGFSADTCMIKSFVLHPSFIYGNQDSILYKNYFHNLLQETSQNVQVLQRSQCKEILCAYDIFIAKNFAYEFEVREKLSSALLFVIQSLEKNEVTPDAKQVKTLKRCKLMMAFIQQNYKTDISLIEIAHSANVKESEALRCFKMVLNTSPIKYLKNYRIEKAATLLKTTALPIIEIGFDCGFSEMSYFSKSFKEVFGITPSEYRKR